MQMGDIEPCDESTFEAVDQKSCKNSLFQGNLSVAEDHSNRSNRGMVGLCLLMENLEISDEGDLNDLLFEELENVHVKETTCSSISNVRTLQFSSPKAPEFNDLGKCAPILCSEALQSCPSICENVESSITELGSESSVAVSTPAKDSLMRYHDSKFMSVLKGSRARQGKPLDPNLHVTWAANVYDPPVTSSSHTVKGHRHHHAKAKAKTSDHHNYKHKHMRSKPSSSDRKHSHRSSSSSFSDPRLHALPRRSSSHSAFAPSYIDALDMPLGTRLNSFKCRNGFQAKSTWPFSQPIAKAS